MHAFNMQRFSLFIYAIMQRQLGQLNIYFYTWLQLYENWSNFVCLNSQMSAIECVLPVILVVIVVVAVIVRIVVAGVDLTSAFEPQQQLVQIFAFGFVKQTSNNNNNNSTNY